MVAEVRAMADSGVAVMARMGNPGALLLFSASDEPFQRLRDAFRPEPGSYADEVIETLQETAAINRLFVTGQNFESNARRAQFMKRWFAIHNRRARADDRTFELVFNFDAVLVMTGSTPATPWFDAGAVIRGNR